MSIDMGAACFAAVMDAFDNIDIVFDVSKLVNDALDDLRRQLQRQFTKAEQKTLKGGRFIILSNLENLNDKKRQWLDNLLKINQTLFIFYLSCSFISTKLMQNF